MTQTLSKRAVACAVAVLQIIPAGLLPQLAHAQQTNAITYGYDPQGNLTSVTDANGNTTSNTPDALHRVKSQTLPPPVAGAASSVVQYTYDGQNRLLSVTDGRGSKTSYSRGGLNDVLQSSKDSGPYTTSVINENGDQYYSTNSRNQSRWVSLYDALNRPKEIRYVDEDTATTKGRTRLSYDATSQTAGAENYGIGHLTSVIDYVGPGTTSPTNSVSLRYDQLGRITWRCQFWAGVSLGTATACDNSDALQYQWGPNSGNTAGRLLQLTYPSNRVVSYQYDGQGRVSGITTNDPYSSTARSVISSVTYSPLAAGNSGDAVTGWSFGDGSTAPVQTYSRQYDTWGRVSSFSLGIGAQGLQPAQTTYSLVLDDAWRVKEIDNQTAQATTQSNVYTYDALNRLKTATLPGGVLFSYDYDANGNRILSTSGGISTTYTYPSSQTNTSNRLSSVLVGSTGSPQGVVNDSTGNVTQDPAAVVGAVTYVYDDRANVPFGRLTRSLGPGAQWDYLHNFFGQRIRKTGSNYTPGSSGTLTPQAYVGSTDTLFYYDDAGHLIAELGATDNPKPVKREYIWLGDTLVAVVAGATPTAAIGGGNAATIYYVHSDHLNTPRMVTDTSGNQRWTWDIMAAEPFGATAANEAPAGQSSDQAFTLNLRFPGQYLDKETGSFYNYFRTYNPSTGRYLQSDPIGLQGGLNTYAYVGGNPLSYTDPKGLQAQPAAIALCAANIPLCAATAAAACWAYEPCRQSVIDGGKAVCKAADNLIFNRPKNPPDVGPPNGWIQGPRRGRQYGPDGRPQLDIDKPHQGNEQDHAHEWPGGEREEPGRPVSPWPPQQQ